MTDKDKLAAERVLKARTELVLAHRFYGVLISQVEPIPSRKFPTMATDGKRHFYNPDFVAGLTQKQLLGVQRHESEHDARHHSTRRGGRDPRLWNEAADYAINIDLVDEGVELPPGALVDPKYRGMSAEDIFRSRELDRQREQKKQEQGETPEADEDESDEGLDEADTDPGHKPGEDTEDETSDDGDEDGDDTGEDTEIGDGDEGGDDGDENGEGETEGDGTEPGEGEEAGDNGDAEGTGNGEAADDGEPGDGQGDDDGEARQGDAGAASRGMARPGSSGRGDAGEEGEEDQTSLPTSCGDPGQCGEVLDSPGDANDRIVEDQKWDRVVRQATSMAKAIGQLPGHVSADIALNNSAKEDWRETLRAWFDQGALQSETWNRPNKRFAWSGTVLPGSRRDGINKVVFLIDTSGSCDDVALGCVRAEGQAALDDGAIDEVVVVYGDTQVTRVDTYHHTDEIDFDPRGRGGTDLKPLFEYVRNEHSDASLIVAFTDLEIGDAGPEPLCPVLWAVHGYPDAVRNYIANAPWGAPGIDVGEH